MIGVCPILYVGWKIIHKTRIYKPEEVDLQKDMAEIAEYERNFVEVPSKYVVPLICYWCKNANFWQHEVRKDLG